MADMMDVMRISHHKAQKLMQRWCQRRFVPRQCFYYRYQGMFVGIDNTEGECFVEEFKDLRTCLDWCHGTFEISEFEKYKRQYKFGDHSIA
ncbi:hypothetical protein [Anaerosinus gibii]|uniref:Uncharacterized protein n=1 Tax=Selenobaculum gibii TaxID=3054208 RepID=A0A9Y2AHP3_9FIRM|nr:hypothetical protein [Selenobaculum gbiensis]WIW69868.1 hypothetical protein P3F81_08040 [Selenobaculum gbiensis]